VISPFPQNLDVHPPLSRKWRIFFATAVIIVCEKEKKIGSTLTSMCDFVSDLKRNKICVT
jgi:hypothetical protein